MKEVKFAKQSAFAPGTFSNLNTQLYSYYGFCQLYKFNWIPVDAYVLTLYAVFLARTFKAPQSIYNYISGIKTIMNMIDYPTTEFSSPTLNLTLKGISRLKQHKPKRAAPITPDILEKMYSVLDMSVPYNVVTWAVFLIAFFSMARKSNLVKTTGSKLKHHVARKDIVIQQGVLIIKYKSSKTNQDGTRHHLVPLPSIPNSNLCPVNAYIKLTESVPEFSVDKPAFSYVKKNNKIVPYTYSDYMSSLKALCETIGLKSTKYSTHSFRRGGATWAFSRGASGELIKTHGDWKSIAYEKYLDFSFDQKLLVGLLMTKNL